MQKPDTEWRRVLSAEQYSVLRQAGTERPFGPAYAEFNAQGAGVYRPGGVEPRLGTGNRQHAGAELGQPVGGELAGQRGRHAAGRVDPALDSRVAVVKCDVRLDGEAVRRNQ